MNSFLFDFEQISGFGGDVIENHTEDLIARVSVYSDSPYQLSYKLWNRTENDKDGYNDVIEERSFMKHCEALHHDNLKQHGI